MGLVKTIFDGFRRGGIRAEADPNDERWWYSPWEALATTAGVTITPELALRASCVFKGVKLISETVSNLPIILYRELENGGKERATDHPLWKKLRRRPNPWQTAQQWRENMVAHSVLWGGGYSRIVPGQDGYVTALVPIHPSRVTVKQLDNLRLVYLVTRDDGTEERLVQEQVFHLTGFGMSPLIGANVVSLAREAIGLWLAMESFNARFFSGGTSQRIAVEVPATLKDDALKLAKERLRQQTGPKNHHGILVLERGSTLKTFGFDAKSSQMVEARDKQAVEIARWLNVPEHMFGVGEKPAYSIEQFAREFKDYSIAPHAGRFEGAVENCLLDDDEIFCEHLFEGLLRGSTKERFDSYNVAIMAGFMTRNEARVRENLNPLPGLDEPLTPLNMERTGADERDDDESEEKATTPPSRGRKSSKDEAEDEEEASAATAPRRLSMIVQGVARRVVHRETSAILREAQKIGRKKVAWEEWLSTFYAEHATFVAEALELEPSIARSYCESHRAALAAGGVGAISAEDWSAAAARKLVTLALEETEHAAAA